jgi:hypothetical protein
MLSKQINYKTMKKAFYSLILISSIAFVKAGVSQISADSLTVLVSAIVQNTPASVDLNWDNDGSGTGYTIYRRENTSSNWGASIASLGSSASSFLDATVLIGVPYEYKIVKAGTPTGYGYINCAIELPINENRGILILVVEDTYIGNTGFDNAVSQTIEDIENDGWLVERLDVNKNDAVASVKTGIMAIYNQDPTNSKAIYIIGHVPIAYSGVLNPDGHSDHQGAWSSDSYYGDVNGIWTDVSGNNTTSAQSRNHNIPGDGKFDQFSVSACELQVGRVDFANMPSFSQSEEQLLIKYLNKAHAYKIKQITATERALVDDNFSSFTEGFSSSGLRSFSTMFTTGANTTSNYRTTLNSNSYMWSYGCGAGTFTSCQGISNTSNMATDSLQTIFTMLFGSYFGDWDSDDNFLRASIAQGQTLNAMWAGRPNWQVHHMALGENIGFSQLLSQNNSGDYFVSSASFAHLLEKMITISLMGDPTTRMHYIIPPSNLNITNNSNDADLTWTASPDAVLGYNVYRLLPGASTYTKVNTSIVTGTAYTDNTVPSGGIITYIVKAVNLKVTASGSYFNQSLGIRGNNTFTVGVGDIISSRISIYPNPVNNTLHVKGGAINNYSLININGQLIVSGKLNGNSVDLSNVVNGIYFIELTDDNNFITRFKILKK